MGMANNSHEVTDYVIGSTSVENVTDGIDFGSVAVTQIDLVNKGSHDYEDLDLFVLYKAVIAAFENNSNMVFLIGTDDVGWWYQGSVPRLPSGKIDYVARSNSPVIAGDGNTPSAITDKRDIGKYVARIIQDERTLNKYVLAYSEIWTTNQIYDLMERLSGEKLPRTYMTEKQIRTNLQGAVDALITNPSDTGAVWTKLASEYQLSKAIRGDNTPESARSLGYLTTKELYPDLEGRRFEDLVHEVMNGQGFLYTNQMKKSRLFFAITQVDNSVSHIIPYCLLGILPLSYRHCFSGLAYGPGLRQKQRRSTRPNCLFCILLKAVPGTATDFE